MSDTDTMTIEELIGVLQTRCTALVAAWVGEDEKGHFYQTYAKPGSHLMANRGLAETLRDRVIERQKELWNKDNAEPSGSD